MNEIEHLIVKAQKYLNSANLLLENRDYDSSVSRSYYAMFYAAEALLLSKNLKFSSHKGVISAFGEHFVKTGLFGKEIRRKLQKAFDERQRSDYSFQAIISKEDAGQILQDGLEFLEEAKIYLKSLGYQFSDI